MRIDKLLADLKYGSRSEVKKLLKNKSVLVNQQYVTDGGLHINPETDEIIVNGEKIFYKPFVYYMLNKPKGYISATMDGAHRTVLDLLKPEDCRYDVFPCGRLDLDTEGLLILSNDGQFAHRLTHPKKEVYKTYYVEVDKPIEAKDLEIFLSGMTILDGQNEPYTTKRAFLMPLSEKSAKVAICEGKFHQVKRMFAHVGKQVTYLKRVAIGSLMLDEQLGLGEYRELLIEELEKLFYNPNEYRDERNGLDV